MPASGDAVHSRAVSRPESELRIEPSAEGQAPPGQFISDEHEADCSRFLEEVKELARRRHEAGLGRER
jgi:hypothetical protein